MRTERQMMDIIMGAAESDVHVRAVVLGGSRVNPNATCDIFMDYDVVFVVSDTLPYIEDKSWLAQFGEELIFQFPDEMDAKLGRATNVDSSFSFLMQFTDGNRIDLRVQSVKRAGEELAEDKLAVVLLDKDGVLPKIPTPSDESHWVKAPSQAQFECCTNEFWWVMPYVAKGLWRGETLYALTHLNEYVRHQLFKMVCWNVGGEHDFGMSVGKDGKYLERYASGELWQKYLATYPATTTESIWCAAENMCELFMELAGAVAERQGLEHNKKEAQRSFSFVKHIELLPKDAAEIF